MIVVSFAAVFWTRHATLSIGGGGSALRDEPKRGEGSDGWSESNGRALRGEEQTFVRQALVSLVAALCPSRDGEDL